MPTFFTPKTLTFLRALKRNEQDREWFKARKDDYEAHVREPLIALIEQLSHDFATFAPDIVATPKASMYRQYRDTRFSEDKTPLKSYVAANFPTRPLGRGDGAGLYVQLDAKEAWIGGGLYHAPMPTLRSVREHLAGNVTRFRAIVESPVFRRRAGVLEGDRLQRVPRGFPADHPAAEYLKMKDLVVLKSFPVTLATTPRFYTTLVSMFEVLAPMVRFINEPIIAQKKNQLTM
jgi:uncharacterized protein (TIGR02453 family)